MSKSVAAVVVALSLPLIAACGSDDPAGPAGGSSSSTSTAPKTLDAAQSAAQEWADRTQSEDYAGAWDLMAREFRVGVTRDDFVTFSKGMHHVGPADHRDRRAHGGG